MRCGVIARKLGMSRVFNDNGEHVPVTILRMEDVEVLSVKSIEKEGYSSVQLGFCNKKTKNISKPLRGVFAKIKSHPKEKVAEFRVSQDAILNVGDKLGVNHFIPGQKVDVGTPVLYNLLDLTLMFFACLDSELALTRLRQSPSCR